MLGVISMGLHLSVAIPTYFFLAMCVHDAIHRAAHSSNRLNAIVGWLGAALLGMTYPVIRRAHLKHHVSHGHGDDIESFVYQPQRTLLIRLLFVNWKCYSILKYLTRRDRTHAALLITTVVGGALMWPQLIFFSWLLPMQIGMALFAFVTVYLPHGPHSAWIMRHIPVITGFHDDHHKMPQYPWYQYFSLRRQQRINS